MSVTKRDNGRWRARYRDEDGKQHEKNFRLKKEAEEWEQDQRAAVRAGNHIDPAAARVTVGEWCDTWLEGYAAKAPATVRQARVHIAKIREEFGSRPLGKVRPSQVRAWTARLAAEGYADSYVYAIHRRLSQVYTDAIHDGLVTKSPCSRRTSPKMGKQRPYLATTAQVWALHDAVPEHIRPAILLGAFAGLRVAEACGLRVEDIDFMRGVITPAVQHPARPLKTEASKGSIPVPRSLTLELAKHVRPDLAPWVMTTPFAEQVPPHMVERAVRRARAAHVAPRPDDHADDCSGCLIPGLPAEFRHHDLRHYFASLLIADGSDVKVVQARLRHASAKTTLDTYSHLWPDSDESTRSTVDKAIAARGVSGERALRGSR